MATRTVFAKFTHSNTCESFARQALFFNFEAFCKFG